MADEYKVCEVSDCPGFGTAHAPLPIEPKGYNGWRNYETWAMHLWLSNEQYSHERCLEIAEEAIADGDHERYATAEILRDEIGEAMPDLGASVWADLLNAAWSEIDWYEIADAYLDAARENAAYQS